MAIRYDEDCKLNINDVSYDELPEDKARKRAALARSKTTINMDGPKKYACFPVIRSGELIPVIVELNKIT